MLGKRYVGLSEGVNPRYNGTHPPMKGLMKHIALMTLTLSAIAQSHLMPLGDSTEFEIACVPSGSQTQLVRLSDAKVLDTHATLADCEEVRSAAHGGVVCAFFTPSRPVGPGAWTETGWRALDIDSNLGLGRKTYSKSDCLETTRAANGGVVCINTGLGAKAANTRTNQWCGASSSLSFCLEATRAAFNEVVCSFPSSGTGAEPGWTRTRVTDSCEYQGSQQLLTDCSASIPR